MNDHELDLALKAMGRERTSMADPPALRERVSTIPLTARRRHRWLPHFSRGESSMFSALKFAAAAAAIVALFGGFLLTSILTTPDGDELAPAAVTESPSPVTTEELLSSLVAEEVEPGVFRIADDGHRNLSGEPDGLTVGPDGSVWLLREDLLLRLGSAGVRESDGVSSYWPAEVAPDGSLWSADVDSVRRFDGETWTAHATGIHDQLRYLGIAIGPDGVAWTMESRIVPCEEGGSRSCFHVEPVSFNKDGSMARLPSWTDVFDGLVDEQPLTVSPDGDVWIIGDLPGADSVLLRFDGNAWDVIPGPDGFVNQAGYGEVLDIGSEGTLWLGFHEDTRPGEVREGDGSVLARLDEAGWATFSEPDGVEGWGSGHRFIYQLMLRVAPDGSVWVNAVNANLEDGVDDPCAGVARFDGVTWSTYLDHICVDDLDIAPDGAVWVVGEDEETAYRGNGSTDAYVITPEAAAAPGLTDDALEATAYAETEGVPYLTIGETTYEADIYAPETDGPSPVVVMFHGNAPLGKDDPYTTVVAEAAAAAGMHVLVPNWMTGTTGITPESFDDFHAIADCAVAYAQASVADGSPVVVYGFSGGSGLAARAALDPIGEPIPGCAVDDAPAPIAGAVLGDGEYFLHSSIFDGAFAADPDAVQAVVTSLVDPTAWPADMETRFRLWVAEAGTLPRTFGDPWDESGWLAQRDPDGSIRADLDRLGQLEDGVISFIDQGQLLELRFREAGIDASLDSYPGGHATGDKVAELVGYLAEAAAVD